MSNIINFSERLNSRRVAAAIATHEAAKAEHQAKAREELAQRMGGTAAAQILADVMANIAEERKAAESAARYQPAYCDPTNEQRGAKHDATRQLTGAEIAKRIRQDIKEALARGDLPKGLKTSVRYSSYSGGQSIDLRIVALPEGFKVLNPRFARYARQNPDDYNPPFAWQDQQSREYRDLEAKLKALHGAYNRDNSDSMVDYFDVRYYGQVDCDWRLRDTLRKAEIEAATDDA
ncbi:hypothetical protein [Phenylobacterium sp.]|uniref:hypothetical protein n=1 Tax=Phenylobacterium sp. TaxID=1871053 RepID=UPI004035E0E3